jgi:SAM-dependent methyltransferase
MAVPNRLPSVTVPPVVSWLCDGWPKQSGGGAGIGDVPNVLAGDADQKAGAVGDLEECRAELVTGLGSAFHRFAGAVVGGVLGEGTLVRTNAVDHAGIVDRADVLTRHPDPRAVVAACGQGGTEAVAGLRCALHAVGTLVVHLGRLRLVDVAFGHEPGVWHVADRGVGGAGVPRRTARLHRRPQVISRMGRFQRVETTADGQLVGVLVPVDVELEEPTCAWNVGDLKPWRADKVKDGSVASSSQIDAARLAPNWAFSSASPGMSGWSWVRRVTKHKPSSACRKTVGHRRHVSTEVEGSRSPVPGSRGPRRQVCLDLSMGENTMGENTIGRTPQYDGWAEAYARSVAENPYNSDVERPAFLELIGDVEGMRALDAGCGTGRYTADLVARNAADVIRFDQSQGNIDVARRLVPAATFRVHDLADPLDWLPAERFEIAVMAMVFHYLDDRIRALRELHRVLTSDGVLVLSTRHPLSWLRDCGGSYFDEGIVEGQWNDGWRLRWRRQPLERTMAEFAEAGFVVERLVEPRPPEDLASRAPDAYAATSRSPLFIAFRLRKSPHR